MVKGINKSLSRIKFPGRTLAKSDTSGRVVAQRQNALNGYLQGVMAWVRQESPWINSGTVSREWIRCTEALEEFLSLSDMAPSYPKVGGAPIVDIDNSLHPSLRSEDWLSDLQTGNQTELFLSHTRTSLQAFAFLFDVGCPLSVVDLVGVQSNSEELESFLDSLGTSLSLRQIFLSKISTGDGPGALAVQQLINLVGRSGNRIQLLHLSGWEMGEKLLPFATALTRSSYLQVLDLSHCNIKDIQTGMVELCYFLRSADLRELYLDENPFGDDGAKLLSVALRHNPVLETLSVKFCKITPFGMTKLLQSLDPSSARDGASDASSSCNSNLLRLYLTDMSMETEDFEVVRDLAIQCSSTLENNSSLQVLDLSGHYFDTEAGLAIMRSLQSNLTLKKLILSYSKRNWNSDDIFLEFFQSNQGVSSLHLRNPMATKSTSAEMSEALGHLKYSIPNDEILKELFTWNMAPEMFALLCKSLTTNSSLAVLDLQSNILVPEAANYLNGLLMSHGSGLQELLVRVNPDAELDDFFLALAGSSLKALSLSNLSRVQGELFVHTLSTSRRPTCSFERISLSFGNGAVHCDLWEQLDLILHPIAPPSTRGHLFS